MALSVSLSDAVDEFLASRKARGIAAGTIRAEASALRQLLTVVGNIQVRNVSDAHVDKLFAAYLERWNDATRNKIRAILLGFFSWCRARRYLDRDADPMEGRRTLRVLKRNRLLIPQVRFGELLDAAKYPRDRMVVALGLYTFLRGSEIRPLRWSDVDLDRHELAIVRTKTKQRDTLPISAELDHEIRRWRLALSADAGEIKRHWFVTPRYARPLAGRSSTGRLAAPGPLKPLPESHFVRIHLPVQRALDALGYEHSQEGNHTLRRSGARALYDELVKHGHDGAGRIVQAMLGHASFAMTERYLGLDLDRKRRDDILRGKAMFGKNEDAKVISIVGKVKDG